MLPTRKPSRQPSTRDPFLPPLWQDNHPEFLRIDSCLPADHHARWLRTVVSQLDLTPLRQSYANRGSRAYTPELLLTFVLFMYSQGILSPAAWHRHARYDDPSKWLLRGWQPSRSQLYTFRNRLAPFLDGWHQQLINWAVREQITSASRGSLDGTFVAALASRHQLMSPRRVDRRLLLLQLLVWFEDKSGNLTAQLEALPRLVLTGALLWLTLSSVLGAATPPPDTLLHLLALVELLGPQALPSSAEGEASWQPRLPTWVPATPSGRRRVLKRYEQAQQRLRQRLQPYQKKKKLSKKDQQAVKRLKVSLTDPDAVLGWDKAGTFRPLYNVLLVQATDAPLTLSWEVLSRNNDDGLLKPMMEKTQEHVGAFLDEVLVDKAFLSVGDVAWCEQEGIVVYAPLEQAEAIQEEVIQAEAADESAGRKQKPQDAPKEEKYAKGLFRYVEQEKVYYCPAGKRLKEVSQTTEKRSGGVELPVIVHRASGQDCQACPQQKRCTSNPAKGRVVKRYEGEEALERLGQRMAEPAGRAAYKQRCQSVELGYADLKEHRGLRVFRCFGRQRARTQAGLVILASNGLKILRILQRRQNSQQTLAAQDKPAA